MKEISFETGLGSFRRRKIKALKVSILSPSYYKLYLTRKRLDNIPFKFSLTCVRS